MKSVETRTSIMHTFAGVSYWNSRSTETNSPVEEKLELIDVNRCQYWRSERVMLVTTDVDSVRGNRSDRFMSGRKKRRNRKQGNMRKWERKILHQICQLTLGNYLLRFSSRCGSQWIIIHCCPVSERWRTRNDQPLYPSLSRCSCFKNFFALPAPLSIRSHVDEGFGRHFQAMWWRVTKKRSMTIPYCRHCALAQLRKSSRLIKQKQAW